MINEDKIKAIIIECLNHVKSTEMVEDDFEVNENTILIGMGGNLDSVAFVAFATEVEEQIEDAIGREFILKLQEIHDLNEGKEALVVHDMARLLFALINKEEANA